MLSVPPPVSVTPAPKALTTINAVCAPVLLIFKLPTLLMVPPPVAPMDRVTPLLRLRLSSESMVRLVATPLMSSVTGEAAPFPLSIRHCSFPKERPRSICWHCSSFPYPLSKCRSVRRLGLETGRPPAGRRLAQRFFRGALQGTLLRKLSPKVASWSHLNELFSKCRSKIPRSVDGQKGACFSEFGLGEGRCYRAETA